ISATPSKVKVRGPASHINPLRKAPTAIISLEGRKESFTQPQTAIEIGDKKVDLIDTVVSVRVEIEERRADKTFSNVAVQEPPGSTISPRTATVTLNGPRSLLDRLRAEEFRIILEAAEGDSISPRLILPAEMEGHVELRSYKLSGFFK
ncbi:MAG: YbbR-like domain-containing protein, partial [Acidobacteria bacterium]|nr:YbbR-like domain-containing protein [Acidobacteriota bacterium]